MDVFVVLLLVDGLLELVDVAGFLSQLGVLLVFGLHVDALLLTAGFSLVVFGLHVEVLLVAGFAQIAVLLLVAGLVLVAGLQVDFLLSVVGLLAVEDLSVVSVVGLHVEDVQDPLSEFPVLEDPVLVEDPVSW